MNGDSDQQETIKIILPDGEEIECESIIGAVKLSDCPAMVETGFLAYGDFSSRILSALSETIEEGFNKMLKDMNTDKKAKSKAESGKDTLEMLSEIIMDCATDKQHKEMLEFVTRDFKEFVKREGTGNFEKDMERYMSKKFG